MGNIKVMLVDDEILAIEYLRDMIQWEEFGFEIVAHATDGKKALAQFEKYNPQIIFVDIRMPVMDGLEFCRKVVEMGTTVKLILLTAYRDFDYAHQAIKLGVNNYILKHDINAETILYELNNAKKELLQEEKNKRIIRQKYFRSLIQGTKTINLMNEVISLNVKKENFVLLLSQVDHPFIFAEELTYKINSLLVAPVDIEDQELPYFVNYVENIEIDDRRFITVVSLRKVYSQMETICGMHELSQKLQVMFRKRSEDTISIVVSDVIKGTDMLHQEYVKLSIALDFSIFYGREKIIMFSSIPAQKVISEEVIHSELVEISNLLSQSQLGEVKLRIEKMILAANNCPHSLKKICKSLWMMLDDFNRKNNLELVESKFRSGNVDYSYWYDVKGIAKWFTEEIKASIENAAESKTNIYSKKTQQALLFIQRNYNKDLSIEQVANEIDISSVYLMKLFQRDVGQTFLEYLTSYRMGVAKKLLSEGQLRVYEVSDMVGYKSSQYFSQVFKKITGKNPLDYKEGDDI